MPRITKVTTKTGDRGETSLGTGKRLPKDAPRVSAYGTVDELNSVLGVAMATGLDPHLAGLARRLQSELFDLGADLCVPEATEDRPRLVTQESVDRLERDMAALLETLPPLENFVMPGGTLGAAHLHVARTVARRAEREVVTLRRNEPVEDATLIYLNRLSDLLFVMARYDNLMASVPEPMWDSGAGRRAPDGTQGG